MRIDELWQEMEDDARASGRAGWLTRFALPSPALPLLVALDVTDNRRALLLPLSANAIPARRDWPDCQGLEIFTVALSGQPHFGIRLSDRSAADVFNALAEDVAPRVARSPNAQSAASVLLGRLRRWQKFLTAGGSTLTPIQQRALYGELYTLSTHLMPVLGDAAVMGWRAPTASHQDFQFASGAIEVKTSSAKQPQTVRITSERQLDTTGIPALFLHIVVLDERDVEGQNSQAGQTLPALVQQLRERLNEAPLAQEAFKDALLDAGYLDVHSGKYNNRYFAVREQVTCRIRPGFPAIVEKQLPNGTGNVAYDLSLVACRPFAVDTSEMAGAIQLPPGPVRRM
jgi:hypothetical protein